MLRDKEKKLKPDKKHHNSFDVFSDDIKIIYEDENILVFDKPAWAMALTHDFSVFGIYL